MYHVAVVLTLTGKVQLYCNYHTIAELSGTFEDIEADYKTLFLLSGNTTSKYMT